MQYKRQWNKEIVRTSSLPLSVGAQTLPDYLSSSADNSYSPRYVRSLLSLTSDLMLFNVAHSPSGLERTLAAQSLLIAPACACFHTLTGVFARMHHTVCSGLRSERWRFNIHYKTLQCDRNHTASLHWFHHSHK